MTFNKFINILFVNFFIIASIVFCNLKTSAEEKLTIVNLDTNRHLESKKFKSEFPNSLFFNASHSFSIQRREVLELNEQEKFYKSVDLFRYIRKYDQFEKDMLFRRLKYSKFPTILSKYPNIPKEKLKKAKIKIAKL